MAGGEQAIQPTHYYVFDLDETLGQMHTPYYFMCGLRPEDFFIIPSRQRDVERNLRTAELRDRLRVAYMAFVRRIAEAEQQTPPLGILRPGILEVFRAIQAQRDAGQNLCCMIYSNNGNLIMLELTRDILHQALGTQTLIRDCVHWSHPLRKSEIVAGKPGVGDKTWAVLQRLLQEGPCGAVAVQPSQVTFFDDRVHPDLKRVLGEESIKVLGFPYRVNSDILADIYRDSLQEAGILGDSDLRIMFLEYVRDICGTLPTKGPLTFEAHVSQLRKLNGVTAPPGKAPPARLADTDELIAVVNRHTSIQPSVNLGNNPLNVINTGVFMGGRGRVVRRRMVTRRRGKHGGKKSRHIRRRR